MVSLGAPLVSGWGVSRTQTIIRMTGPYSRQAGRCAQKSVVISWIGSCMKPEKPVQLEDLLNHYPLQNCVLYS